MNLLKLISRAFTVKEPIQQDTFCLCSVARTRIANGEEIAKCSVCGCLWLSKETTDAYRQSQDITFSASKIRSDF